MGGSQSTNRAAKFSGTSNTRRTPPTSTTARRTPSVRNTNRSVKDFSKYWSDAGCMRSKSPRGSVKRSSSARRSRAQSTERDRLGPSSSSSTNTPFTSPRSPREKLSVRDSNTRSSLRAGSGSSSPYLEVRGRRSRQSSGSIGAPSTASSKTDVYSDEFTHAAMAAARLKRMSLRTSEFQPTHHSQETPIY
ncbi:unnamed protein product [Caenorhabditis auriculariae]|uniref:Uncharacterized protein n=1 Tax=Caenorhabditis auriculariae TaxID=2777116 RepID=A0A8S1HY92_9PELO|nr:unnamed protein product [Caenorhabditis auriculariae]